MAKKHVVAAAASSSFVHLHRLCYFLLALYALTSLSLIYFTWCSVPHCADGVATSSAAAIHYNRPINLLSLGSAWNHLRFSASPPPRRLKIALFVKKWPQGALAGGLERHAMTLYLALRGHELHVFTTSPNSSSAAPGGTRDDGNIHLSRPTAAGNLDQSQAWEQFHAQNSTGRAFDVVYSKSVAIFHGRARRIPNLAVSWHGIAYETIHSDIVHELLRAKAEARQAMLAEKVARVVEEVRFFPSYSHHIATSDHVGDVLKRVYMIPDERVHVIINGADEKVFKPDATRGREIKMEVGVPEDAGMVIGMAGRLVKDKGHPIMFDALRQLFEEDESFQRGVVVLVAGDGPWSDRYSDLGPNVMVLGPLERERLAEFYNALDVFVNPTLRAQGLDNTFLEAMLAGVPVMGTRFASVAGSLIKDGEVGYTFSPTVASLKGALRRAWEDAGRRELRKRGEAARTRALELFTATKMAAAYERLFLCISQTQPKEDKNDYCMYPLRWDEQRGGGSSG
ncbi:hypothetical protein Taro_021898 [Colocasia esculenta]|uniref:Glycosyltransferase subfamily 4-like N-terminal domain-containing protein n=1 Tax=Colocasia esculenta TaxID=4460 RepID=A0A843V0B3_COLES|nr:hypothetical protein [Colocasia esculenta]